MRWLTHSALIGSIALTLLAVAMPVAGATPHLAGRPGDAVAIAQTVVDLRTPSHRFGFDSVLNAPTSIQKLIASPPGNQTTATVQPGQSVSFQVNVSGLDVNSGTVQVVDFFTSPGLAFSGGSCAGGAPAGVTVPAGQQAVSCSVGVSGAASSATGSFTTTFTVSAAVTPGSSLVNQACVQTGPDPAGFSNCAAVTLGVGTAPALVQPTPAQVLAAAQGVLVSQLTIPCASPGLGPSGPPLVGTSQTCTIGGAVTGTITLQGGGITFPLGATVTETVTIPGGPVPVAGANSSGIVAGLIPQVVVATTIGLEQFTCAAVTAGTSTLSCTETTTGIPLAGPCKLVFFGPGVTATGTCDGPGSVPFPPPPFPPPPLPPPPPLELFPPPPPPLLPPPGIGGPPIGGFPAFPEVPVVPETDTAFLLIGGLVVMGSLAGLRALRRRPD